MGGVVERQRMGGVSTNDYEISYAPIFFDYFLITMLIII
jgi:hypothetical protein